MVQWVECQKHNATAVARVSLVNPPKYNLAARSRYLLGECLARVQSAPIAYHPDCSPQGPEGLPALALGLHVFGRCTHISSPVRVGRANRLEYTRRAVRMLKANLEIIVT